jgi:hypothetical protein
MAISENAVQNALIAILAGHDDPSEAFTAAALDAEESEEADEEHDGDDVGVDSVSSFGDDGVMTYNKGVVLRLTDGSEFQLTIVRSR